ncbi:MAG: hypothetical protein ABI273_15150 [Lacunisphaera sp.]
MTTPEPRAGQHRHPDGKTASDYNRSPARDSTEVKAADNDFRPHAYLGEETQADEAEAHTRNLKSNGSEIHIII